MWHRLSPAGRIAVPYLIGYTAMCVGISFFASDASIPYSFEILLLIVVAPGEFPLPGPMWPRLHYPTRPAGAILMLIGMVVNVYLWSLLIAAIAGSIRKHSRRRGAGSGSLDRENRS